MPTSLELQGAKKLRALAQVHLPRALDSRELLKIFPLTKMDRTQLVYERRQLNTGLQGATGIDGRPTPVKKPGIDVFKTDPGYYADSYQITATELINLRDIGKWNDFENYGEQSARGMDRLTQRFLDRCESSIASIMMTGKFAVGDVRGAVKYQEIFNVQQFTPGTLFSDLSNSTPLNYIRSLIPTLELLVSVSFMKGFMLMSRPTANLILNNQNAADLNGRRLAYGQTVNNLDDFNDLMASNDLPKIRVYDEGYYSDPPGSTPTKNRFLTNGKIVLVGVRNDGEQLGEYHLTRAPQNENSKPGEWYQVKDKRNDTPCEVILRGGHAGGPVPFYTEGFAVVNAAAPF